jgi:hypothetical protein
VVLVNKQGAYQPTPFNILAVDKVRYVGEAVVLVARKRWVARTPSWSRSTMRRCRR